MATKAQNISLVLAVLVILAVFAAFVRVGATADSVVVMRTSGMACGSCMADVMKTLQKEKGVAATEGDLGRGLVMAGFDSKQVSAEKLARKVTEAGYASRVQAVLTPEAYRKAAGHPVGHGAGGQGCCGEGFCQK